jgi:hypothetical protein
MNFDSKTNGDATNGDTKTSEENGHPTETTAT